MRRFRCSIPAPRPAGCSAPISQDEWKITNKLTLNAGLRFDQMWQYVDANQLSPRVSLTWKPFDGTTFHAGYSRNFTPPRTGAGGADQPGAGAEHDGAARGVRRTIRCSRNAPTCSTSALFRRSTRYRVSKLGIDGYYKTATDLLDDGQFGAAYVLTAFNYARGDNVGVELKANYTNGNFRIYGNLAWAKQIATNVVSNQYLFDPDELAYIANNYVYTDHAQILTASVGAFLSVERHRASAHR